MRLRWMATATCVAMVLVAVCGSGATDAAAAATGSRPNPYFAARFSVKPNASVFGQDPSWTPDGRVLSNEKDSTGIEQVYVSKLDGSSISCLTCGQPGPNGFPQERPQGDWILFCSWRGQTATFGAPCLGGTGTDLYLMRPDGSHVSRLTQPGQGFESDGVPFDNYHPYWSPDGRQIAWTHVEYRDQEHGGTQWTMLVADVVTTGTAPPRLAHVTVVGPAGDHAYETQAWAPNGSGFLFTNLSSAGDRNIGWLNTELNFLRLHGRGASPRHPRVTRLTDGHPGWDEQAVFTPDSKSIIWMSSRGSPTWYQTVVTSAQQAQFSPARENDVVGAMFVLAVLDPRFHTDLYQLDLATHATRRLTHQNLIVPEFSFDPRGTRLLWTTGDKAHTFVGSFAVPRRSPTRPSPDPRWIGSPRHGNHEAPAAPVTSATPAFNSANLPAVVTSGLVLLEGQLSELARRMQQLPQGGSCCR